MTLRDTTIAAGGLHRCCLATIQGYVAGNPDAPALAYDGTQVQCPTCGENIVLNGQVWVWDREPRAA